MTIYDLCVIGGGIAGLSAALKFLDRIPTGRVIVLEAGERWGGAVQTVSYKGYTFEAGAGRIEHSHRHTRSLLRRFGLSLVPLKSERSFRPVQRDLVHGPSLEALVARAISAARSQKSPALRGQTFFEWCSRTLGPDNARRFQAIFGYNAEFADAQAAETLRSLAREFGSNASFYLCREGLSALVYAITQELRSRGADLRLSHPVRRVRKTTMSFYVNDLPCRKVIFAVPPSALARIEQNMIAAPLVATLTRHLLPVSLVRIYARFQNPWTLPRCTTDGMCRQVIPIRPEEGFIMAAYCDGDPVAFWKAAEKGRRLPQTIIEELSRVYGEDAIRDAGPILWTRAYFWDHGVHVWTPGIDPASIRRRIRSTLPIGVGLAGEAYSSHLGWLEGAITSSIQGALRV